MRHRALICNFQVSKTNQKYEQNMSEYVICYIFLSKSRNPFSIRCRHFLLSTDLFERNVIKDLAVFLDDFYSLNIYNPRKVLHPWKKKSDFKIVIYLYVSIDHEILSVVVSLIFACAYECFGVVLMFLLQGYKKEFS